MTHENPTDSPVEKQGGLHTTLLTPAISTQTAAKIGLFGGPGVGKTLTSILIAVGLSKQYHNHAPIAIFDPEDASDFVAHVCALEGVPLVHAKARSFVEMREALKEAEDCGCCAYDVDNYTMVFTELVEALKEKAGLRGRRLPYQFREEVVRIWSEWTREMRLSPLHVLLGGRLGYDWGDDEDESGDPIKVKLGTKMRGETDAGYEPNLLIELEAIHDLAARDKKTRSKRGSTTHHLHVLKDRFMVLNGRHFAFRDLNEYKPKDYEPVFNALKPHFDKLSIGQSPRSFSTRTSAELFAPPQGESSFAERQRRITVAVEELKAGLEVCWPGRTDRMLECRTAAIEALFSTRSMSAVEHLTPDAVEFGVRILKACEAELHSEKFPTTRAATIAFVFNVKTEMQSAVVL